MLNKIPNDLQMPHLRAIQEIPGNTAGEKLKWIGKLTSSSASGDSEQLPQELLPLLRVEIALKKKKHDDITAALKCEDWLILNRALKATWFFDGSHKDIVNADYFCERIFPYVSLNTRVRIINILANRMTDPELAQKLFTKITSIYGFSNAYPLLLACDEEFAYKTIQQQKFVLPIGTAKKFFRKNPDFIVRYLKLLKPVKATERAPFPVNINKYKILLPKLIKKRLEAFVDLLEMNEENSPNFTLSNTCTEIFLKKGQQYLNKKPYLYIDILQLKKINEELMENIFEGLLPVKTSCFETDKILKYLEHYPKNKRYELLRESYKAKYNSELLDEDKNISPALLQLLPAEERIKQARILFEKEKLGEMTKQNYNAMYYEKAWICYLPVNEAIPILKEKISKTSFDLDRANLICQMFYACKVNEDDDALINTLIYFKNRHKNEESWIFERIMNHLLLFCDIPHFNAKQHTLLFDIVQLFHVKNKYVPEEITKAMIHFRLIHDMPIDDLIRMLIDTNNKGWLTHFNVFKEHPQYNRKCLVTFAKILEEKYKNKCNENSNGTQTLCRFVLAMYEFNDTCKKSHIKIEYMKIQNYNWLLDNIKTILNSSPKEMYVQSVLWTLKKKEPELYRSLRPEEIANVTSGEALTLLKRNPENILNNWEQYFTNCMKKHYCSEVHRFVRATRWYQDIPIKFVESSMSYLYDYADIDDILAASTMLAILLHGNTLIKLVEPLIPTETAIETMIKNTHCEAEDNYALVKHLPYMMNLSNPPVSLELVAKLCEGDFLSLALRTLTNVSRRSCLPKVLLFAHKLYDMRVGARKHGVRLMYQVAPVNELTKFLQQMWDTESHHSIREVIFNTTQKLFSTESNPENWFLYCSIIHTMQNKDESLLSKIKLFPSIPDEYVEKYFQLWLETINDFELKLNDEGTNKHLIALLQEITVSVCNLLSDKFAQNIIIKYLFDIDVDLSKAARNFSMLYLFPEDEAKFKDRNKKFVDTFYSLIKVHWNKTHPKKARFYPFNNAVHLFMEDFILGYVNKFYLNKSTNTQLIDDMLKLYSSVLVPTQDARSYLLLTYAKKLQECMLTNEGFGVRVGQHVLELVKIFSTSLVQFMAMILDHFLNRIFKDHNNLEELKLTVIEGLIKADNIHSCFMAVVMLSPVTSKNLGIRYDQLIKKFREMENPAIASVLNDHLNMSDFKVSN